MSEVRVRLGVNCCFLTRRYEEPESWVDIIRETGFKMMSLDSDILDPFFSGDMEYIHRFAHRLKEYANKNGVEIVDYLTGMASYRFIGLAHKDKAQRDRMKEWFKGAIEIASDIGAWCAGGRCDAYSNEALNNSKELEKRYNYVVESLREMASFGKEKGLESIYFEQMYAPSLKPYTMDETEKYIVDLNKNAEDMIPIRPVLDVGHACAQDFGISGDDLFYERWIERYGAACRIIHIQQTPRNKSEHGAFAAGVEGDITIEGIVDSLEKSIKNYKNEKWYEYIEPVSDICLLLEVIPSTAQNNESVIREIKESYEYLSKVVPADGLIIPG